MQFRGHSSNLSALLSRKLKTEQILSGSRDRDGKAGMTIILGGDHVGNNISVVELRHIAMQEIGHSKDVPKRFIQENDEEEPEVSEQHTIPVHLRLYSEGIDMMKQKDIAHENLGEWIPSTINKKPSRTNAKKKKINKKNRKLKQLQMKVDDAENTNTVGNCANQSDLLEQVKTTPTNCISPSRISIGPLSPRNDAPKLVLSDPKSTCTTFSTSSPSQILSPESPIVKMSSPKAESGQVAELLEKLRVLQESYGLSEDDIKWKVDSAKGNAFCMAEKKLEEVETEYDRLLYEQSLLSGLANTNELSAVASTLRAFLKEIKEVEKLRPILTKSQLDVIKFKKIHEDISTELEVKRATSREVDEKQPTHILDNITNNLTKHEKENAINETKMDELLSTMTQSHLKQIPKCLDTVQAFRQRCTSLPSYFESQFIELQEMLQKIEKGQAEKAADLVQDTLNVCDKLVKQIKKESTTHDYNMDKTLKDIETWRSRMRESKEYAHEMSKKQKQWDEDNMHENQECLKKMRSLMPTDLRQCTIEGLIQKAKDYGSHYTYELANYLKKNTFLHWCITHASDIAKDNFLAGEGSHFFTNLEQYDLTELRAVYAALPAAFEVDRDGRKAEWRALFAAHVQSLASQAAGATVRSGWDPLLRQRGTVRLKPLNAKQTRNGVYQYPTDATMAATLEKFEKQNDRLRGLKKRWLELHTRDIDEAREEYNSVSADSRNETLVEQFGRETLKRLRDEAKKKFNDLTKERDSLQCSIKHLEETINTACPTHEQYKQEVEVIRSMGDSFCGKTIEGPFPTDVVIQERERSLHRKKSALEEAQERKTEMTNTMSQRGKLSDIFEQTSKKSLPTINPNIRTERSKSSTVVASPLVLKFLENDLCSPRTTSPLSQVKQLAESTTPKSKTLLNLITQKPRSSSMSSSTAPPKAPKKPSFLSELMNKVKRGDSGSKDMAESSKDETETPTHALHAPMPTVAPVHPLRAFSLSDDTTTTNNNNSNNNYNSDSNNNNNNNNSSNTSSNGKKPSFLMELQQRIKKNKN